MAIQKAIKTTYGDGQTVWSNVRNNFGAPIFQENDTLTLTKVTTWYDGTPMNDAKVDNKVYLKASDEEGGGYYRVNLPNWGETFLEKNTMAQMRGLSPVDILLLKAGYYKGVKLNGYYTKGDTPSSIDYYISSTSASDDGGSVIEVGDVKFVVGSGCKLTVDNFGAKSNNYTFDSYPSFKNYVSYCNLNDISLDVNGNYLFVNDSNTDLVINVSANFRDSVIRMDSNGFNNFRFTFRNKDSNIINLASASNRIPLLTEIQDIINNNKKYTTNITLYNKFICVYVNPSQTDTSYIESNRLGYSSSSYLYKEIMYISDKGDVNAYFYNNNLNIVSGGSSVYAGYIIDCNSKFYITGGNFSYLESQLSTTNYRNMGVFVDKMANAVISNLNVDISKIENRTYNAIGFEYCYNIDILKCIGLSANHAVVSTDSSYIILGNNSMNVLIDGFKSPLYNDTSKNWGVFGSNYIYNLTIKNSQLNRIDSHYRAWNTLIDNCEIGSWGVTFSGGGFLKIINSSFRDNQFILRMRADYASEFRGDIIIDNVDWFPNQGENIAIMAVAVVADARKFHPNNLEAIPMSEKINFNNINVSNKHAVTDVSKLNVRGLVYYGYELSQDVKLPSEINLSNITLTNTNNQTYSNTSFNPIRVLAYETLFKIKQGANGNNSFEAGGTALKPTFEPNYNCKVNIHNIDLRSSFLSNARFYEDGTSSSSNLRAIYNSHVSSGLVNTMPLFDITITDCKNVDLYSRSFRENLNINNCSVVVNNQGNVGDLYIFPSYKISDSNLIVTSTTAFPLIDTNSAINYESFVIDNCSLRARGEFTVSDNSPIIKSLGAYMLSNTYTPIPVYIHQSDACVVRGVVLSKTFIDKINALNTWLSSNGYLPIDISFLRNILNNGFLNNYVKIDSNEANFPSIRANNFGLKSLKSSGGVLTEYILNGTTWTPVVKDATTSVKGLVNQATASADTATQASGATPTKAEFDALLAELRDVKTKLRTAGTLAPNTP